MLHMSHTHTQLRDLVPAGMCVHINQGKARDQVLEVIDHFNICVTEKDIFSRCQVSGDMHNLCYFHIHKNHSLLP